ncbi:MAG: S8 family peptidase [Hyphomonadaceae bacterium]
MPAFDSGIFGEGALIAIIDTGIDLDNAEFAGRIDPRSEDIGTSEFSSSDDARTGPPDLQDNQGHGTSVAGIAAAAANGQGVVGVAPLATILALRGNIEDDPDTDDDDEALTILGGAITEGFRRAVEVGADVINLSLGSDDEDARDSFASLLTFAGGNDIVTVLSAGNEGDADPQQSGQSVVEASVGGTGIVVGAVDGNNNVTSFTNTAGLAQDFFIVAPGLGVPTPAIGGGTRLFSGTSAAAPHVAGAVGLVRSLWPQLSAAETVDIILESATDLGAPGTDEIFGRGLLNIGAALEPSGSLSVPSATGSSVPISALASSLPSALGSGFASAEPIIGLDRFGRDFTIDINDLVSTATTNRFPVGNIAVPNRRVRTARDRAPTPGASLTYVLTETSAATDLQFAHLLGDLQSDAAFEAGNRRLAVSFNQSLGLDKSLTIATGFSGRDIDRSQRRAFTQDTISRTAFSDAYLPDAQSAISAGFNLAGPAGTELDFFVNHARADDLSIQSPLFPQDFDQQDRDTTTTFRVGITHDIPGGALRLETGVQSEQGGFLGTDVSTELFGNGGTQTVYNAISGYLALSDTLSLTGRFSTGLTKLRAGSGDSFLAGDTAPLLSTQFSVGLQQAGLVTKSDVFSLSVSQPLQVRSGDLTFSLPTGFNQQTEQAEFTTLTTGFATDDIPLDIEAGYRFSPWSGGVLQLNLAHSVSGLGRGQSAVQLRLSRQF